jgi:hypothetical protein
MSQPVYAIQESIDDALTDVKSKTADEQADAVIKAMVAGMVAAAVVPAQVNWALIVAGMGTGVIAIGQCYGVEMTKDEAWKLIKQFFIAAGFTFMGLTIGTKFFSAMLASTGIGYGAAVCLDIALGAPLAYAVGSCAKTYFREDLHKKQDAAAKQRLGAMLREKFFQAKREQASQSA